MRSSGRPSCASKPPTCARARSRRTTAGSRRTRASVPWLARRRRSPLPRPPARTRRASRGTASGASGPRALAGPLPVEVVADDPGVVKAEVRPGDLRFREPSRVLGVVVGLQDAAARAAGIHGRDGVLARIPPRVGIGEQLLDQLDVEAGLLARLPPAS